MLLRLLSPHATRNATGDPNLDTSTKEHCHTILFVPVSQGCPCGLHFFLGKLSLVILVHARRNREGNAWEKEGGREKGRGITATHTGPAESCSGWRMRYLRVFVADDVLFGDSFHPPD